MRKLIDIPDNIMQDLQIIAVREKRNGKTDPKNFIEDLVISYVGASPKMAADRIKSKRKPLKK